MKAVQIPEKCQEKWEDMTPTQKGAFCNSCAMEVIDFSQMSPERIKLVLHQKMNQKVCGRIEQKQLDALNHDFHKITLSRQEAMRYASFFSLLAVFGLMLFSCNSSEQIAEIQRAQRTVQSVFAEKEGVPKKEEVIETEPITTDDLIENEVEMEMIKGNMVYELEEEIVVTETKESTMLLGAMVRHVTVYDEIAPEQLYPVEKGREYDEYGNLIPAEFDSKVYPNPAVSSSKLELALPSEGNFVIGLYDLGGKHIRNIHEGELKKGTHTFNVPIQNEKPGTYLVVIRSKEYSKTIRVLKN